MIRNANNKSMIARELSEVVETDSSETGQNWFLNNESTSLKEGFDLDRFVEVPRKDFQCPICLGVVREPLECTQCGVLLCRKCACNCGRVQNPFFGLSSNIQKFNCPLCRNRTQPKEPSAILKKLINSLVVYCKNKKYSCEETRSLAEIKTHEKECEFKAIRCANHQMCNKQGNKSEFISVELPRIKKNNERKMKLVCSEICKKVVMMDYMIKTDQIEKAIAEYKIALEALDSKEQ